MERKPSLSKPFKPLIESLAKRERLGLTSGTILVYDKTTSCSSITNHANHANSDCADRFKLKIPYGGHCIIWEVMLNYYYPEEPPDFIFGIDDVDFHIELDDIKTLCNWNAKNPDSLINVIEELLIHYKTHQQTLLLKSTRLQSEFSSLLEQGDIRPDDVEIYVKRTGNKLGSTNFLINLPVDLSNIPAYITCDNPGKDIAVLLICFNNPEGGKITPQLFLSPRVEHALGPVSDLRIPYFPTNGHVFEYVPLVCDLLKGKIGKINNNFDKRKEYVATFLSYFGRSIIEYDSETFSKISFLFEWNDFFFVVHIDITINFPAEQPIMTFQSVYHEFNSKPFSKEVKDYPYSPRWSACEMAERAKTYMSGFIADFQKLSITGGSI